jgi:hypothetical protein
VLKLQHATAYQCSQPVEGYLYATGRENRVTGQGRGEKCALRWVAQNSLNVGFPNVDISENLSLLQL